MNKGDKMDTGEKEMRKAFEEVTRKNVESVISFSNKTREMMRELEERVQALQNMVMNRDNDIKLIKQQLALLQTIAYSGGTTAIEGQ
jgi:hypothetical protein